jgi:hypothetical protein
LNIICCCLKRNRIFCIERGIWARWGISSKKITAYKDPHSPLGQSASCLPSPWPHLFSANLALPLELGVAWHVTEV